MQTNRPKGVSPGVRVRSSFRKIVNSFFDCEIESIASHYKKIADGYLARNGPIWTCSRLKAYYNLGCKVALQLDVDSIPFCKADSNKIPKDLKPMIPFLKSKRIEHRRACLTVLRLYTQIYAVASEDTTTITESGTDSITFKQYEPYFSKIITKYKYFLNPYLNDESMFKTSKKGPNGPALLTLDKDLHAIKEAGILETILSMHKAVEEIRVGQAKQEISLKQDLYPELDLLVFDSDKLENQGRLERKKDMMAHVEVMMQHALKYEPNRYDKCLTSKLGFLSEGGCKTRVIAIGDYFTQDALKPLHRSLYRCLNKLKTDGTSSHNRIGQLVKSKTLTAETISSFDLTAATDRFPIFIQEFVLSGMYTPKIASLWRRLMTDRDFTAGSRQIRYNVGQPMGLLSSWAAFALTHHITIEAIALKAGFTSFKDYCIIGDDVTIFNKIVADGYREFLNHFKIEISEQKSLESVSQPLSAEIAKRLFLNGQEVSPIPFDAIESAIKDYRLVPNLMKLCAERGVIVSNDIPQPVQDALDFIFRKRNIKNKVRALLSFPWSVPPFGVTQDPWKDYDKDLILSQFNEIKLDYIKSRAQSLYQNELMSIPDMGVLGLVLESEENPDISRHPFMSLLREYRGVCGSIHIGIVTKGLESKDLDKIPYLVNPMVPAYMRRIHQIERVRSSLILKTFKAIETLQAD
jgi:hypothetical protein